MVEGGNQNLVQKLILSSIDAPSPPILHREWNPTGGVWTPDMITKVPNEYLGAIWEPFG